MEKELFEVLQKYWGFSSFRPPQEDIIKNVLAKKDTVALLPTGGGKSLCYQLPALLFEGKTVVITPLIALMEDQVKGLERKGVKAKAIHSHLSFRDIDRALDNFVFGDIRILFISPERIQTDIFKERFKRANVDMVAIDEAHCISQWGYDFRPAYLQIEILREWNPKAVFMALTATATNLVLKDIQSKLSLSSPVVFRKSFYRDNISFFAFDVPDKKAELLHLIRKMNTCGIIYVRNRGETLSISTWLRKNGVSALPYHGGMTAQLRHQHQEAWMNNDVKMMVSTNAFGMGIDKPDVRFVVHLDIPNSLEEYYQEAGRAGRDGKPSWAVLFYENADIENAKSHWSEQFPELDEIGSIYDKLCRYFKIAYGSGQGESFIFHLTEIATAIKVPVKKVFRVTQILAKEEWIELSEGVNEPTRIQIICDRNELYVDGTMSAMEESIVVQILRKYEGVFTQAVKIDEFELSKDLLLEEEEILENLQSLVDKGIAAIQWKRSQPYISFIKERPELVNFTIDHKRYHQLKMNAGKRLESMIQYVSDEVQCRQKAILTYFDENIESCGTCDLCRIKTIKEPFESISNYILDWAKEKQKNHEILSLQELFFMYPIIYRPVVKSTLKRMENEKLIQIHPSGRIVII